MFEYSQNAAYLSVGNRQYWPQYQQVQQNYNNNAYSYNSYNNVQGNNKYFNYNCNYYNQNLINGYNQSGYALSQKQQNEAKSNEFCNASPKSYNSLNCRQSYANENRINYKKENIFKEPSSDFIRQLQYPVSKQVKRPSEDWLQQEGKRKK